MYFLKPLKCRKKLAIWVPIISALAYRLAFMPSETGTWSLLPEHTSGGDGFGCCVCGIKRHLKRFEKDCRSFPGAVGQYVYSWAAMCGAKAT